MLWLFFCRQTRFVRVFKRFRIEYSLRCNEFLLKKIQFCLFSDLVWEAHGACVDSRRLSSAQCLCIQLLSPWPTERNWSFQQFAWTVRPTEAILLIFGRLCFRWNHLDSFSRALKALAVATFQAEKSQIETYKTHCCDQHSIFFVCFVSSVAQKPNRWSIHVCLKRCKWFLNDFLDEWRWFLSALNENCTSFFIHFTHCSLRARFQFFKLFFQTGCHRQVLIAFLFFPLLGVQAKKRFHKSENRRRLF